MSNGANLVAQNKWKFKVLPYRHQEEDTAKIQDVPFYGLFWEMRLGKTKCVIDSACLLYDSGKIDTVVVITPAAVRGVWIDEDPELGEIKKHSWVPSLVLEYHNPEKVIWADPGQNRLNFLVTNYEFIRMESHRTKLKEMLARRKFLMVLDESSFIKNHKAEQTKACFELGALASRRIILNGTPVGNSPLDLWSQVHFLSTTILPFPNFYSFRFNFCDMRMKPFPKILRYKRLDYLQALLAPHVVRREQKDCLDLPEKIKTHFEVKLSPATWKMYKQMRDECVVWMDENPSMASQAGVKVMRLSQITSGFLGGFLDDEDEPEEGKPLNQPKAREVSWEKLDWLRTFVLARLEENPERKIIVWCRFRPEIERVAANLHNFCVKCGSNLETHAPDPAHPFTPLPTYRLYGQKKAERDEARERFSKLDNREPALLAAQPQAGGFGLNLIAADVVVYLSHDYSLTRRLQSEERAHGPGQLKNVLYVDVLATGPDGQKTIDHTVVKALRQMDDLANWTTAAWKKALEEE